MHTLLRNVLLGFPFVICLLSCQKELSVETPGGLGGSPDDQGYTGECNDTKMKLKRFQDVDNPDYYIEVTWNNDGSVNSVEMHTFLSEYRTATYIYENNRISQAVLSDPDNNDQIYDTAIFRYNAEGLVDSMYLKNDNNFNIKLDYTAGKLVKYTGYTDTEALYYLDVNTDAAGNVIKSVEYFKETSGFELVNTHLLTRDTRKNPLAAIAPYMMYLDDAYNIFWYWGPNNFVDQTFKSHTMNIEDVISGHRYKYNSNCYPVSSQATISGFVLFDEPHWLYTYY